MSTVEFRVIGDGSLAASGQVEQIGDLCVKLMGLASEQGDSFVAIHALAGAYVNLVLQAPADIDKPKALRALGAAGDAALKVLLSAQAAPAQGADERVIALANRIGAFVVGEPHHEILDALLNLFIQAAIDYPCCTAQSARGAAQAAEQLAAVAAASRSVATAFH